MTYDILKYIIGGLISAIVWLIVNTINSISKNQKEIANTLVAHEIRLTKLETEQDFIQKRCGNNV